MALTYESGSTPRSSVASHEGVLETVRTSNQPCVSDNTGSLSRGEAGAPAGSRDRRPSSAVGSSTTCGSPGQSRSLLIHQPRRIPLDRAPQERARASLGLPLQRSATVRDQPSRR